MTGAEHIAEHIAAAQELCGKAAKTWNLEPEAAAGLAQAHATVALVLALTEPSAASRGWARLRAVVRWSR